jgi:Xaa-Pro aminopeptidase
MDMTAEKLAQAVDILRERRIDAWLTFVRESATMADPVIEMTVGQHCTWQTAWLVFRTGATVAIAGSLDVAAIRDAGRYAEVVPYVQGIGPELLRVLEAHQPASIAINYSVDSAMADGLTHGMYLTLMRYLEGTPFATRLVSAEPVISALRGRKTPAEIARIKQAIAITLDIYDQVTGYLKPGRTEQDVARFILKQVKAQGVGLAWAADHCPAVFTGPDHAGAHYGPTTRRIERGHVLNIDFGVKVDGYCSDLQRTWYIARSGETKAPAAVTRGLTVIRDAIRRAADTMKPGAVSWTVDAAARDYIVSKGYVEYPHGLGHQVGRAAHDGGVGLLPRWERYGQLPFGTLESGQVFTIEPRLPVEGYGVATIEEIVWLKDSGVTFLSKPQTKVWVV